MKVLHVCICSPFTDGLSYQENELIEQHVTLGYDVTVISATDTYSADKRVVHTSPGTFQLRCGARLIRLPYVWGLSGWIATKIRAHRGLKKCLESIQPDRILFHGLSAWDLRTVAQYVRRNPDVRFFADCHEDFNNSATTWASHELLHKCFYKPIFRRSVKQITEILCVTVESLDFAIDFYKSPKAKTCIYPLGCVIENESSLAQRRLEFRRKHKFSDSDIIIAQTGKLDKTKRLGSALSAFRENTSTQLRFVIAGRMTDEVNNDCMQIIQADERITYLDWQTTDELKNVLAGSDFFLQPFGQTVTTQMAMGYGCAILAQDLPSHRWLVSGNGRLFRDASELGDVFQWVVDNKERIPQLSEKSFQFAKSYLDYRQLALRIIS